MLRRLLAAVRPTLKRGRPAGPQAQILVVDDDDTFRALIVAALSHRGYLVRQATNGRDGVRLAEREHPDAIVLDANMPVLDGFGTLKELRKRAGTARIPVVMLTARWQQGDVVAGFRYGAQDYLTKPVVVEEVLASVATLIEGQERR
jgi:DNA-binding response OmpR family regulator